MHPIHFYNTLTRRKEEFVPIKPGEVGMYTCGPTVYDLATIGNMRTYVFADVLRRTLEYNGLTVAQVMNVTDVGHLESDADEGQDKMLIAVAEKRKTPEEIAEANTEAFLRDLRLLNIKPPSHLVWATEHISEMIAMVQELVDKGYGYEISDGIYFDISRFPQYGQLSGAVLSSQKAGARVEENPEKRHPADFALWKKAPKEHIMQWKSPWGMGYPGWHIECSAMARCYLGDQFDIHTGGEDHIPTHHENEIAQSEACSGRIPARFWMHGVFLLIDGGKMSKSLGNVYTVKEVEERGFMPLAFRYLCLGAHYRSKLNFTWEALANAQNGLISLRKQIQSSIGASATTLSAKEVQEKVVALRSRFIEAVNDDLNMPRALAVMWDAAKAGLGESLGEIAEQFDNVLSLDLLSGDTLEDRLSLSAEDLPPEVIRLLDERQIARRQKDWALSDSLRDTLREMGYSVKDTKEGYEVTRL